MFCRNCDAAGPCATDDCKEIPFFHFLGIDIEIPARLRAFMEGEKQSVEMTKEFADFKAYLMKV